MKAQNIALAKADELYRMYAYSEAIESYERLLKRNPDSDYIIQQLAYSYQKVGQFKTALGYYEKHVESRRARYEDQFQYGMLLLIDEQLEKAVEQFQKCMDLNPDDKRPAEQIERIRNFDALNLLRLVDSISCMPFNTRFSDMSPAFFKDSIAYISARDSSGGRTYSWNNQPFLDIYQFGVDKKGNPEIQKIPGINTKYHEGPLTFTNNDETVWFTRNDQGFSNISGEQTNILKIFNASWDGKKWKNIEEFQHNSEEYSVGHPAFSPDGNTMYFASSKPNGFGKTDLYKVKRIEVEDKKGNLVPAWSEPENLGPQFNTAENEMFPFVDSRGVILFASDGLPGFGGLDIFAAFPVADTFNVINLGQPINSTYDDFSFIVKDDFTNGYLTSNRPGGVGSDDIYAFHIGLQKLLVNVKALKDDSPIRNAEVKLTVNGNKSIAGTTNEKGELWLDVDAHEKYYLEASMEGYISNSDSLVAFEIFKLNNHKKTIYLDNASMLQLLVLNEENSDPVAGVEVEIRFTDGNKINKLTDASGKVTHRLTSTGAIEVDYKKDGFVHESATVVIDKIGQGNFSHTINMVPIYEGKTITLEHLYYDSNSSLIRPDAALVLDEVYGLLMEYPNMKIELSSHTDSRGDASYNQWLSQKRAQSAVEYLIKKGIKADRLVAVGYGESKLLNRCADGVECSDEEHQQNRRTEIEILEF